MNEVLEVGLCTNSRCRRTAQPTEYYEGPGEFCPECGERLEPVAHRDPVEAAMAWEPPPKNAVAGRLKRWFAIGAVVAVLATAGGIAGWQLVASQHFGVARVCTSSVTGRLVNDIVGRYAAKTRAPIAQFKVEPAGTGVCDVRFWTARYGGSPQIIAHDGAVVVVNPQNNLMHLTEDQVRDIFAGRITNWAQIGEPSAALVAYAPDDTSDEMRALADSVMRGTHVGSNVQRTPNSAIVRAVASASGRRSIGLVPFSAAATAKVVAVGTAPEPSVLSIADGRYPMSFRVLVESDLRAPSPPAAALLRFARSNDAQSLVRRDGLIGKVTR